MRITALSLAIFLSLSAGCVSSAKHEEQIARANSLASEKSALEAKGQALAEDLAQVREELASLKAAKTELSGQHEFAKSKLADTETDLEKTKETVEEIRTRLAQEQEKGRELLGKHEFTKSKLEDTEMKIASVKGRLKDLLAEFNSYKSLRDKESEALKANWGSIQKNLVTLEARMKEVNAVFFDITAKMAALSAPKSEGVAAGDMVLEAEKTRTEMDADAVEPSVKAPDTVIGTEPEPEPESGTDTTSED